jgi:hypothetical protein
MDNTGMKTLQLFVIFLQVTFAIGTYCYLYPQDTDHQFSFVRQTTAIGSILPTSSLHDSNPFHYLISEIIVGLMLHLLDILVQISSMHNT